MRLATTDTTPHARANMDLGIGHGSKNEKTNLLGRIS